MSTRGVVMRPMDYPSFGVPFINAAELYFVSFSQVRYSWRDVDIVSNEQGLPGAQLQDETLVPASFKIIRKNSLDQTPPFDLKVSGVLLEGATKDLVAFR